MKKVFSALILFLFLIGCGGGGGDSSSAGLLTSLPLVAEPSDTRGKADAVHVIESLEFPQIITATRAIEVGDDTLQNAENLVTQSPINKAITADRAGFYSGFSYSYTVSCKFLDENKNEITNPDQFAKISEIRRERKGYVGNFSFESSLIFENISVSQYQRGQIWIFSAKAIHVVSLMNAATSYSCSEEHNLNCTVNFASRTVSLILNGFTNFNLNGWSAELKVVNNQIFGWIKKGDVPQGSVTITNGSCVIIDYETGDEIVITSNNITYNIKNGIANEFEGSWRGAWSQGSADGTIHYLISKKGEISGTIYHRDANVEGKIWGFAAPSGKFYGCYKYPDGKVYGISGQFLKIDDYVRANFTSVVNGSPTSGVSTLQKN